MPWPEVVDKPTFSWDTWMYGLAMIMVVSVGFALLYTLRMKPPATSPATSAQASPVAEVPISWEQIEAKLQ
jgi:hypothetical protein